MRQGFARMSAAGVGIAIVLAGCSANDTAGQATSSTAAPSGSAQSSTSAAPSSAGPASADSVAWMDGYCGQVLKLGSFAKIKVAKAKKGDVAGAQKAVSEYLGKVIGTTESFVQGLQELPAAPAPAGDKAVERLVSIFVPAKDKLASVKAELDSAAPTNKQAIGKAAKGMQAFGQSMKQVGNPMKPIKGSSLMSAAKQAPKCKKLVA